LHPDPPIYLQNLKPGLIMNPTAYLRIRFPREQRVCHVTLSVPGGVGRALDHGNLPTEAEALLPEIETWVPLREHPDVTPILGATPGPSGWPERLASVQGWAGAL
jgi:hypothetical protein